MIECALTDGLHRFHSDVYKCRGPAETFLTDAFDIVKVDCGKCRATLKRVVADCPDVAHLHVAEACAQCKRCGRNVRHLGRNVDFFEGGTGDERTHTDAFQRFGKIDCACRDTADVVSAERALADCTDGTHCDGSQVCTIGKRIVAYCRSRRQVDVEQLGAAHEAQLRNYRNVRQVD